MWKEHHGKATQERVVHTRVDAVGPPRVGDLGEGGRPEVNDRLEGQTLSGAHGLALLHLM
jgi:hypothetical protein